MKRALSTLVIAALMPTVAMGASYADGAGADFSWTNASDNFGRFGQPLGSPFFNEMFFPNASFSASASSNQTTAVDDTFTADLIADLGLQFSSISLITRGTRTLEGSPGVNHVTAIGALTLNHLVGDPFFGTNSYLFFDDVPPKSGAPWEETTMVTIPFATSVTTLNLQVDQDLVAVAADGTAAITATFEIVGIAVTLIPEPASLSLLLAGGLVVLRRNRR